MILQVFKVCSPNLVGKTDSIKDAQALRDAMAKVHPNDTFVIVEVLS